MMSFGAYAKAILPTLCFSLAFAQERPFLFTLAPPDLAPSPIVLQFDAAYGRETFEPIGGDNVEQTLGIQTGLTKSITLSGKFGVATTSHSTSTSQQLELLMQLVKSPETAIDMYVGPGFRREYGGTNVLLGRIIVGRRFAEWQVYGNMLLEKPFSEDRDALDLLLAAGWSYDISPVLQLGFEAVGQDLEGFWDPEEAEGGATLFIGPTVAATIPESSSTLTFGIGPIIRATQSNRTSSASRDFPVAKDNGFVIHAAINFGL